MQTSALFYIESMSPLFEDVQRSGLMPDSKTFPDCIPTAPPAVILEHYQQQKDTAGFNLSEFIRAHFDLPYQPDTGYESGNQSLPDHLNTLWDVLVRRPDEAGGTLIPLPFPYIVPGGRFREIYYWDSYFTMLGLQVSGRSDIMCHMVDNFAQLIDLFGMIPNGNRTYYLGRSQPPFFAPMVQLLADTSGKEILVKYYPQLLREYAFWMDGADRLTPDDNVHRRVVRMPDGAILNRYWDDFSTPRPEAYIEDEHIAQQSGQDHAVVWRHIRAAAESGWDFSSRWFRDPGDMATIQTADIIPVDLNCLLHNLESLLADIAEDQQDTAASGRFRQLAAQRKMAIQRYCWDETVGFYTDYQFRAAAHSDRLTLAGVFPLFFNLAEASQALKVAERLEHDFLHGGGFSTTLLRTGQQWDAPNGWAPLQWISFKGLMQYGYTELAGKARSNWLLLNDNTYAETGKMMEKYNVIDSGLLAGGGEYPNQDGFGWTNGVYLALSRYILADVQATPPFSS
jgi:alpha,alpha-trehalase